MAGTFEIFSESDNSLFNKDKSNKKTFVKTKSVGSTGLISSKGFTQPQFKSKGLSIRSESDLNVSISRNSKSKNAIAKEVSKLQGKKSINQKLSPSKIKVSMSEISNLTPKKLSPSKQKVDDFVFAKPATPKDPKKSNKYPEPEKLYYDFDHGKFIVEEVEMILEEDRDWLKSARSLEEDQHSESVGCEDEGFISGGEIDSFEIEISSHISELSLSQVELPEISDLDDSI